MSPQILNSSGLYPLNANPYYIVAPPYTRFSAGIRVLHLLCSNISLKKIPAYILIYQNGQLFQDPDLCEPDLLTPLLTERIARNHFEKGLSPITIYPEIIAGNPLGASCVVRYVLNFPGELGGENSFDDDELCFGFSRKLAESAGAQDNILFLPISDTRIFHPPKREKKRNGSCFYAHKYQHLHGGELFEITNNSIEITSGLSNSQTPEELAELFRQSELFYSYENTALTTEATLCGCPTVLLPNAYLTTRIISEENRIISEKNGEDGVAWGFSDTEIQRAQSTVGNVFESYLESINNFSVSLDKFISKTQEFASKRSFERASYLNLLTFLNGGNITMRDSKMTQPDYKNYAPLFSKLPWKLEQVVGELLCTLGLISDGAFLLGRAKFRQNQEKPRDNKDD